jgi:branched-chain amino acid aminotransferase
MANLFVNVNGKVYPAGTPVITADNRGFRYGDGLFETMKVRKFQIRNQAFHFDRLFEGLSLMKFVLPAFFSRDYLAEQVIRLCQRNNHPTARVRLSLFRGDGGLYDAENHFPNFLIQTWPLSGEKETLNENGLVVGIYHDAVKSIDRFSNLKTKNFLPYFMGALHAQEQKWNDAIILNSQGNVCDSTVANIFLVKGDRVITPALSEGCVKGVMRRTLLAVLAEAHMEVAEETVSVNALLEADEVWFTNAMQPLRWVGSCEERTYQNVRATRTFDLLARHFG